MIRAVIADDLTGASDAGVQFAGGGRDVVVWLDHAAVEAAGEFVVVDTDSRFGDAATAYDRVSTALRALAPRGPAEVAKKMDSTLRGQAGAEIRAFLDVFPGAIAVVCPAYPKNRRTTREGLQYAGDVAVDRSDAARDLFSPVGDARVAAHLDIPTAEIRLDVVRRGTAAVAGALEAARRTGARAVVIDAETDDDLGIVAGVAPLRDDLVWAGSAGILEQLAAAERACAAVSTPPATPASGPVAFIVGSLNSTTRAQVDAFARGHAVARLDPVALLRGDDPARPLDAVRAAHASGEDVLIASAPGAEAARATLAYGTDRGWSIRETADRLRSALIAATRDLIAPGATTVLSGGDVARAFCTAHGIRGMRLVAETAPGIPLSQAIGADAMLVTKAGGFGGPETYLDIVRALHGKVTT